MRSRSVEFPRLAFVDIETTGLGPARQRIAEIAIVTIDESGVDEWSTLVDPGRRLVIDEEFASEAAFSSQSSGVPLPRFADIANEVSARLNDRLFVAHNARFDYAFVQAELARCGIPYHAPALCTMMLSRRLDPLAAEHHLDALIDRHRLDRVERHRALPDARALHQLWDVLVRSTPRRAFDKAVGSLLAGPLLPPHLHPGMIDALPERPGVFVLEDEAGKPLHVGRASNLRRQVIAYFRTDRQCARADDLSHRVRAIRAEVAEGPLDARLIEIARRNKLSVGASVAMTSARRRRSVVSIRVDPSAPTVATPVFLDDQLPEDHEALFGLFATERRARNALAKIAMRRGVCARLVGLPHAHCVACNAGWESRAGVVDGTSAACTPAVAGATRAAGRSGAADASNACALQRSQHLARFFTAIAPLKLPSWPYRAPIAIREGRKVHVFDHWRHLGSVRAGADIGPLLEQRSSGLDADVHVALMQMLPRVASKSIRVLKRRRRQGRMVERDGATPDDVDPIDASEEDAGVDRDQQDAWA